MAHDVATFLAWSAEPHAEERKQTGFAVMIYLFIFAGLAYASYEPDRLIDNRPEAIFNPDGTAKGPIAQFNVPVGAGLCGWLMVRGERV